MSEPKVLIETWGKKTEGNMLKLCIMCFRRGINWIRKCEVRVQNQNFYQYLNSETTKKKLRIGAFKGQSIKPENTELSVNVELRKTGMKQSHYSLNVTPCFVLT